MVLYRLSTHIDPAWDLQTVRDTVDLLVVVDGIIDKMQLASGEAGEQSEDDLFAQITQFMQTFRAWAADMLTLKNPGAVDGDESGWVPDSSATATCAGESMDLRQTTLQSIEFGNYMWLGDFFARF
jgi:hypothetical protein